MSNSAINIRPTFRDSNGLPRANGLLTFYVNKTTTLASIFSDEDLTVAQANPYTLDAFGRTAGDIKYTGKLTVKATNADGKDPTSDDDVITGAGDISITEQFQTTESDPQAMTALVKAGKVMDGETLVSKANQTTTTITAPTTNPRIDRIVINRLTGVFAIITGSESASPTAPTITAGNAPSSQILLATTTTVITDALITDERISGSVEPSNANTTETLTNKTLGDTNTINAQDDAFTIDDNADATKQVDFSLGGATTSTKTTITASQTANRTLTLPDATDTLVGKATTDTVTNKSIDLTNNTVTGTTAEFNTALSDGSFATLAGTETLTNKTIDLTDNTVNGTLAEFNTAISDATIAAVSFGTWTPELSDSSSSVTAGGQTYSNQVGVHYIIGDLVFASCFMTMTSLGSLSGSAFIHGLPETHMASIATPTAVVSGVGMAITSGTSVFAGMASGGDVLFLLNADSTTGRSNLTIAEVSASGNLNLSITYRRA